MKESGFLPKRMGYQPDDRFPFLGLVNLKGIPPGLSSRLRTGSPRSWQSWSCRRLRIVSRLFMSRSVIAWPDSPQLKDLRNSLAILLRARWLAGFHRRIDHRLDGINVAGEVLLDPLGPALEFPAQLVSNLC
jgi:hypothetical protein